MGKSEIKAQSHSLSTNGKVVISETIDTEMGPDEIEQALAKLRNMLANLQEEEERRQQHRAKVEDRILFYENIQAELKGEKLDGGINLRSNLD